ncbi:MAG: type II toxin-antitoxin system HicB family antitoxin [Candidatus Tectomicrobia bacterium]|uniref:Type II toxin-antitoxin system HicB family antitoxin n=1 Tax=Tectimicrobiota bacterium TaxID=2528274 RepID=A0A932GP82_UNCTE|nr:type II toxin-antitoxin system HicB family antitoxin [Candidatus Tectomicrobia bacterium]
MGKESYTYTVVYEKVEGGGYNVFIPAMRDYRGQAPTLEDARELGKQMVAAALEELARKGMEYPDDLQLRGRKIEPEDGRGHS